MYLSMAVTVDAPGVHAAIASRWMETRVSLGNIKSPPGIILNRQQCYKVREILEKESDLDKNQGLAAGI